MNRDYAGINLLRIRAGVLPAAATVFLVGIYFVAGVLVIGSGKSNWGDSRPIFMLWSFGVLAIMVPLLARSLLAGKIRLPLFSCSTSSMMRRWPVWLLLWNVVATLIGFARGSPPGFLLGDIFKYALLPIGFFMVMFTLRSMKDAQLLLFILAACSVFPGLGTGDAGIALAYVLGAYAFGRKNVLGLLLLGSALVFTLAHGKTTLLLVPIMLFVTNFVLPQSRKVFSGRFIFLLAMVGGAVTLASIVLPSAIESTGAYRKTAYFLKHVQADSYEELDDSTYQRIQEAVLVGDKFLKGDMLAWITGYGNGAVYLVHGMPAGYQALIDKEYHGYAHNIHLNPVFIFHQWGMAGVLLVLWLMWGLFRSTLFLHRIARSGMSGGLEWKVSIISLIMLLSFLAYGLATPPKNVLIYIGMVLGVHIIALDRLHQTYRQLNDFK